MCEGSTGVWRSEVDVRRLPSLLSTVLREARAFSWTQSSLVRLAWVASLSQESHLDPQSRTGHLRFDAGSGIQTLGLSTASHLSHLPMPPTDGQTHSNETEGRVQN